MKTTITRVTLSATLAALCALAGAAQAAPAASTGAAAYGAPAPRTAADRTIVVGHDTRYVNVNDGETVRFVDGDQSFTWTFDTARRDGVTELGSFAPAGFADTGARVYIAPNPLYNDA